MAVTTRPQTRPCEATITNDTPEALGAGMDRVFDRGRSGNPDRGCGGRGGGLAVMGHWDDVESYVDGRTERERRRFGRDLRARSAAGRVGMVLTQVDGCGR
jgi:hypothetical protein